MYGEPTFVKLDVEGSEPAALGGLTRPVKAVAFEYLPQAVDRVAQCVDRLERLDRYVYNWSRGESYRFESAAWMEGRALLDALTTSRTAKKRSGDVYARRWRA